MQNEASPLPIRKADASRRSIICEVPARARREGKSRFRRAGESARGQTPGGDCRCRRRRDACRRWWKEPGKYRQRRHASRSEEHTSELQSHLNLVCRLLLEKKKTQNISQTH